MPGGPTRHPEEGFAPAAVSAPVDLHNARFTTTILFLTGDLVMAAPGRRR